MLRLAVEDIEPGNWVAWALELPGCYASGPTAEVAVEGADAAIRSWHGRLGLRAAELAGIEVVERFASFLSAPDYRVNAFFADDARALAADEVDLGLRMLEITRVELRAAALGTTPTSEPTGGETARILEHVARAEWWYLTRLGLASGDEALPAEPLAKAEAVRAMTRAALPELVGDGRVVELRGERWSARKLLRRALWHEQDHTAEMARAIVFP